MAHLVGLWAAEFQFSVFALDLSTPVLASSYTSKDYWETIIPPDSFLMNEITEYLWGCLGQDYNWVMPSSELLSLHAEFRTVLCFEFFNYKWVLWRDFIKICLLHVHLFLFFLGMRKAILLGWLWWLLTFSSPAPWGNVIKTLGRLSHSQIIWRGIHRQDLKVAMVYLSTQLLHVF